MEQTTQETAWRNYQSAWRNVSNEERRQLLEASVAEQCVYNDPGAVCNGRSELIAYLEQFQERMSGAYFVNHSFKAHHLQAVSTWSRFDANGNQTGTGASFAVFSPDGLLLQMTGFPDPTSGK